MTTDKVFEKADLLLFFNEDAENVKPIGSYSSIQEEGRGDLFTNTRREHRVRATTRVWFCEKHRFAVVEQTVIVSDGGTRVLAKDHPYRDPSLPRLSLIRGGVCHNSADLTRESVRLADEWRDEMAEHVPEGVIDMSRKGNGNFASQVFNDVAEQINAGALDGNGVTVTAKVAKAE